MSSKSEEIRQGYERRARVAKELHVLQSDYDLALQQEYRAENPKRLPMPAELYTLHAELDAISERIEELEAQPDPDALVVVESTAAALETKERHVLKWMQARPALVERADESARAARAAYGSAIVNGETPAVPGESADEKALKEFDVGAAPVLEEINKQQVAARSKILGLIGARRREMQAIREREYARCREAAKQYVRTVASIHGRGTIAGLFWSGAQYLDKAKEELFLNLPENALDQKISALGYLDFGTPENTLGWIRSQATDRLSL
jgi:hypothetical protein